MPRKKKELGIAEPIETAPVIITDSTLPESINLVFNPGISLLDLSFGRDDLNQLVVKINEIIKKVNK
jgi:hypothetical protein